MGYANAYQEPDTIITGAEVKYLDRLFIKASTSTKFGRKFQETGVLVNEEVERRAGSESFYQQVGMYLFGDNWFAFRHFNDSEDYRKTISELEESPLLEASDRLLEELPDAIDKALVEIEKGTKSEERPNAYRGNEFRNGAWQTYREVRKLVPKTLPTIRDKRTIKRKLEKEEKASIINYDIDMIKNYSSAKA